MRREVEVGGGPGGAHLQLVGARGAADLAEADGGGGGDGAAEVGVLGAGAGESFGEPFPGDVGEQRVGGDLVVHVGLDVGDEAHGTLPGLFGAGVVEEDEAAEGVAVGFGLVPGAFDLEADGVAERCQALRRADRAEGDLVAELRGVHRLDGLCEGGRGSGVGVQRRRGLGSVWGEHALKTNQAGACGGGGAPWVAPGRVVQLMMDGVASPLKKEDSVSKLNFDELNSMQRYTQFVTFRAIPGALGTEREEIITEARAFFDALAAEEKVVVRGIYDVSGINAEADLMIWWHAEEFEDLQAAYQGFRRTTVLGQLLESTWIGTGLHRPAEFNRSHLPSFIMGEEAEAWITVYPFVRSYEWYLLDPKERRRILAEHGQAARDFPDVRANTVPAFALGDYEWMLAFEGPRLDRIVDLMHQMRYTDARLHVREETPFFSGRRVADIGEVAAILP